VNNLLATCGLQLGGRTLSNFTGNGSSPCNRQVGIYIDPINEVTLLSAYWTPISNSQTIFQNLFAQGNPGFSGERITGSDWVHHAVRRKLWLHHPKRPDGGIEWPFRPSSSGQVPGLSVVFNNQPNYQSPYSQQAEFGVERQVGPGFSISASYIYSHTVHLPVAIDTNLQDPGFVTVPLANGKTASYRDWNSYAQFDPFYQTTPTCNVNGANGTNAPFKCFYSPFIAQNNQYTSRRPPFIRAALSKSRSSSTKRPRSWRITPSARPSTPPRTSTATTDRRTT